MKGMWKAALALLVVACGRDAGITEPSERDSQLRSPSVLAIGVDPSTGATIETNKDDYMPGEVVHLTGRGWAPGETVNLHMTEAPNTHADVDTNVVTDASGEFSIHFYDVQPHDLGVTFTLTATGQTSGSVAVATFYDGEVAVVIAPAYFAVSSTPRRFSVLVRQTNQTNTLCVRVQIPSSYTNLANMTVSSSKTGWTGSFNATTKLVTVVGGTALNATSDWVRFDIDATANATSITRWFTSSYTNTGCSSNPVSRDPVVNIGNSSNQNFLYTADFRDPANLLTTGSVTVGSPTTLRVRLTNTSTSSNGTAAKFGVIALPQCFTALNIVSVTSNGNDASWSHSLSRDNVIIVSDGLIEKGGTQYVQVEFSTTAQSGCGTAISTALWASDAHSSSEGDPFRISGSHPSITIASANTAPELADITNFAVNEGSLATFDANATDANAGQAITYSILAPGAPAGASFNTSTGEFSWTPTDGPSQTVTLTVRATDNGSPPMSDDDNVTITVNNVAPTVNAGASTASLAAGATFSRSGSYNDAGTADTHTGTVDYGDGSGSQTLTLNAGAKTFNLSHPYTSPGTYDVLVTINDDDGGTVNQTIVVTVTNSTPVVSLGAATATLDEGGTFSRSGSFTDDGVGPWTATVDYGDGGGVQPLTLNADKTFSLSHVYPQDGALTVTVVVNDGNTTGSNTVTVTVNNVLPIVSAGGDATINEGSTFSQSGSFTDPGADTWTATVNYGDGSGNQALTLSGKNFTLSHTYADDDGGPFTVTVTVNDDDGNGVDQVQVTVNNVAPVLNVGAATASIDEGSTFSRNGSFTDPGSDVWSATVDYDDGSGPQTLPLVGKTFSLSHLYAQDGAYTVTVSINDGDGGTDSETITVTVNNVLPVVSAGSNANLLEGGTLNQGGSFTDPGADSWTATVNYGDGSGNQALTLVGKSFTLNHTYLDDDGSPFTVTVTVTDDKGNGVGTATVTVSNVAPSIVIPLTLPTSPVAMGSNFNMTWTFTDPGSDDWTCKISWDLPVSLSDGFPSSGLDGKTCSISGSTLPAGVYTVTVYVEDDDNGSDQVTATAYIVVYDPNAGFVTGGGWINSPLGAYLANPTLTGKATFGFVAKYKKGQQQPEGNTEFQFHAAGMNFKATSYDWLVIASNKAQYKGVGTVNGATGYGFMLTALDGDLSGNKKPDSFRMKIWLLSNGSIVYDNNLGVGDTDDPGTTLGGGSIVIHSK